MPGLAKLVFIVLVIFVVWYALRWVNRARQPIAPRRAAQLRRGPMIEAEDLVACRVCGTYMPVSARNCSKPRCPLPR
jgi:membrane protein implicated in regulation of membrane protease activity